jgi:integrase
MASTIVNCTVETARRGTMILVADCHGLRASEVCDLQWHQVELEQGRMHVSRAKSGTPSVHAIRGDEVRMPCASSAARARPRLTSSSPSDAADVAGLGPSSVPRHGPGTPHPPPARERKITSGPFPKSPLFFGFWALTH